MDFADFIAPLTVEAFRCDYHGRRPLHLKAAGAGAAQRREILSWSRLDELLSVPSHWSESNLKLLLDSRAIGGDHYLGEIRTPEGVVQRADAAKVQMLLGLGASIVANRMEDVDLDVRRVTAMLGEEFAALAGANAYGSFKGVRAFDSHCDLHDVFAVQLDGRKNWRIYANRAQAPVQKLQGPNAQAIIDSVKGPLLMDVAMEAGDLLYIPRGYYHDALASSDRSLHLTFSVAPLDGRILFRMIEDLVVADPEFREHLPDHRAEGGAALRVRLEQLADKVQALLRSEMVATRVAARQRGLALPVAAVDSTRRPALDQWLRTAAAAEISWSLDGPVLRHGGETHPVGILADAVEWALDQASFSTLQVATRFSWLNDAEVARLTGLLTETGLFVRNDRPS